MIRLAISIVCFAVLVACGNAPTFRTLQEVNSARLMTLTYEWQRMHDVGVRAPPEFDDELEYRRALRSAAVKFFVTWSESDRSLVTEGKLWSGQTGDMLWWSLGPPRHVDKRRIPGHEKETWHYGEREAWSGYGDDSVFKTRIYLDNGIVDWWEINE